MTEFDSRGGERFITVEIEGGFAEAMMNEH
jgi:hypothetical protein